MPENATCLKNAIALFSSEMNLYLGRPQEHFWSPYGDVVSDGIQLMSSHIVLIDGDVICEMLCPSGFVQVMRYAFADGPAPAISILNTMHHVNATSGRECNSNLNSSFSIVFVSSAIQRSSSGT